MAAAAVAAFTMCLSALAAAAAAAVSSASSKPEGEAPRLPRSQAPILDVYLNLRRLLGANIPAFDSASLELLARCLGLPFVGKPAEPCSEHGAA